MPKSSSSFQTEQSSKGKYTSFNLNALLPKQKPHTEKGLGNSRMQVLGKSSVLSRVAPKVPLPFNLPSLRKESAVEATSETDKDGKDCSPHKVEVSRHEQPNSYATVAASRMKPHSVRYSPTMSGKSLVESDEHFSQDTNTGLQSLQAEDEKNESYADTQQKNFPFLSHSSKSPAKVSSVAGTDSKETFQVQGARGNVEESERFRQSVSRNIFSDNREENEQLSFSVENESFSESEIEKESGKPFQRVILKRQEETRTKKQEAQSWRVERERDFPLHYAVSSKENEPFYESDTVSGIKHDQVTVPSTVNLGFLSDSNLTFNESQNKFANEGVSRVSEKDYLKERSPQNVKPRYKSSRARTSSRYRQVWPSESKGRRRRISSENIGRRSWRVVSDQRKVEEERKASISDDKFPKDFAEEKAQDYVLRRPSESLFHLVDNTTISQGEDTLKDIDVSEMNNMETFFQNISIQETSSFSRTTEGNIELSTASQGEYSGSEECVASEEEIHVPAMLTFGSLLSDLNALNDSSLRKSPTLVDPTSIENSLSNELWSNQVNNAAKVSQSDTFYNNERTSSTPISKSKHRHKLNPKRNNRNVRLHKKKAVSSERDVSNGSKKSGKVWMAKQSISSFDQSQQNLETSQSSAVNRMDHSTLIPNDSNSRNLTFTVSNMEKNYEKDKASRKWRKVDLPNSRGNRTQKEWVAKQTRNMDNQPLVDTDYQQISPQEKNTSKSKPDIRSSSVDEKIATKSAKVSNHGQKNSNRWRKVVTERATSEEVTSVNEKKESSRWNNYRPDSWKRSPRGRQHGVLYVPKNV